jgi:hypothetical protein
MYKGYYLDAIDATQRPGKQNQEKGVVDKPV